jgi:uncharacterized membrane protein
MTYSIQSPILFFSKEGITEQILEYLEHAAVMINLVGVAVIIGGFLLATGRYMHQFRQLGPERDFAQFKIQLGQALLLGLEILVVADVIETITTKPTFASLVLLACLIAIRTLVSWTLCLEIEGRWPWQEAGEG